MLFLGDELQRIRSSPRIMLTVVVETAAEARGRISRTAAVTVVVETTAEARGRISRTAAVTVVVVTATEARSDRNILRIQCRSRSKK